jgi:hypothetical protein
VIRCVAMDKIGVLAVFEICTKPLRGSLPAHRFLACSSCLPN